MFYPIPKEKEVPSVGTGVEKVDQIVRSKVAETAEKEHIPKGRGEQIKDIAVASLEGVGIPTQVFSIPFAGASFIVRTTASVSARMISSLYHQVADTSYSGAQKALYLLSGSGGGAVRSNAQKSYSNYLSSVAQYEKAIEISRKIANPRARLTSLIQICNDVQKSTSPISETLYFQLIELGHSLPRLGKEKALLRIARLFIAKGEKARVLKLVGEIQTSSVKTQLYVFLAKEHFSEGNIEEGIKILEKIPKRERKFAIGGCKPSLSDFVENSSYFSDFDEIVEEVRKIPDTKLREALLKKVWDILSTPSKL